MPFAITPAVHRLLKSQLGHNLKQIWSLQGDKGLKLSFDSNTGQFGTERDGDRGRRNRDNEDKNTAASKHLFEYPLLVTLYECRKLERKMIARKQARAGRTNYADRLPDDETQTSILPTDAFSRTVKALRYLHDYTYNQGFKKLFKGSQRATIRTILDHADELHSATTQPQLDGLLASWVPFVVPDDVRQLVEQAARNNDLRRYLQDPEDWALYAMQKLIYKRYYKTGGEKAAVSHESLQHREYLKGVVSRANTAGVTTKVQLHVNWAGGDATLQQLLDGQAWCPHSPVLNQDPNTDLGLPEDKFFIFFRSKNKWLGEPLARVYIHLRMDAAGTAALGGLQAIFSYLQTASPSVLQSFCRFKICSLQSLSEFADSVVMWTSSLEASRALAEALSGPLRPFTAPSNPTGVKRICEGIGI